MMKNSLDNLSSEELEMKTRIDSLNNEITNLINKYADGRLNKSVYSDMLDSKNGFFLMWVKKDMDAPEDKQLEITSFAEFINADEVIVSMQKVLTDISTEQQVSVGTA